MSAHFGCLATLLHRCLTQLLEHGRLGPVVREAEGLEHLGVVREIGNAHVRLRHVQRVHHVEHEVLLDAEVVVRQPDGAVHQEDDVSLDATHCGG